MPNLPRLAIALLALVLQLSPAWAQQLDCNPCNDHYGRVKIGTPQQHFIQLKNVGSRSLRISAKSVTGDAFALGNYPLPVDLAAGARTRVPIIFTPNLAGRNTGTITVSSNAKNRQLVIAVRGIGVAADNPRLVVTPSSLDFGSVTVGSTASLPITLSASSAPVTISSAQSNSAEFSLPGLALPLTVGVGQNVQVTVRFTPSLSGTASGKLTLASNADNSPSTVSLAGVGVPVGSHSADLSWDASQDAVIGYNVYRGGKKGGPFAQINPVLGASTNYTDSTVNGGTTYYYVVTAVDANNRESTYSNEVKAVIPNP